MSVDPTPETVARPDGAGESGEPAPLSIAAVALMKGVVYRESHEQVWRHVLRLQHQLRDHVGVSAGPRHRRGEGMPICARPTRTVSRRSCGSSRGTGSPVSLLLALLRKAVAECDATSGEGRLVLTRDRIAEDLRTFLADSTNEACVLTRSTAPSTRSSTRLPPAAAGRPHEWEVRWIIKAFVDAQWLGEFDTRLREYAVALGRVEAAEGT